MNVHDGPLPLAEWRKQEHVRSTVFRIAGACPACAHRWAGGGSGRIYRSSNRSVTMRCPDCGLLWTVTVHQMAKAARSLVDELERRGGSVVGIEVDGGDARTLERWAAAIPESRGRASSGVV